MANRGKPYENLVALVAKALHPGAAVEVGEWVEGPDGTREIDVSVRGQIDDKQTFILIECKDWKKDVGIAAIDALDSKRHDVAADKTMISATAGSPGRSQESRAQGDHVRFGVSGRRRHHPLCAEQGVLREEIIGRTVLLENIRGRGTSS